jgi:hypothetical protein
VKTTFVAHVASMCAISCSRYMGSIGLMTAPARSTPIITTAPPTAGQLHRHDVAGHDASPWRYDRHAVRGSVELRIRRAARAGEIDHGDRGMAAASHRAVTAFG